MFEGLPTLGWDDGHGQRCRCGAPLVPFSPYESALACYGSGKRCCEVLDRRTPAYERRRFRDPESAGGHLQRVRDIRGIYWTTLVYIEEGDKSNG